MASSSAILASFAIVGLIVNAPGVCAALGDITLEIHPGNSKRHSNEKLRRIGKGERIDTDPDPQSAIMRHEASGLVGKTFQVRVNGASADILLGETDDEAVIGAFVQFVYTHYHVTGACVDNKPDCNSVETVSSVAFEANLITVGDIRKQKGGLPANAMDFRPFSPSTNRGVDSILIAPSGVGCWALQIHEGFYVTAAHDNFDAIVDYLERNNEIEEGTEEGDRGVSPDGVSMPNGDIVHPDDFKVGGFQFAGYADRDFDGAHEALLPDACLLDVAQNVPDGSNLRDLIKGDEEESGEIAPEPPPVGPPSRSMPSITYWAFVEWDLCRSFKAQPKVFVVGEGTAEIREEPRAVPPFDVWTPGSNSPPAPQPQPNSGGAPWEEIWQYFDPVTSHQ